MRQRRRTCGESLLAMFPLGAAVGSTASQVERPPIQLKRALSPGLMAAELRRSNAVLVSVGRKNENTRNADEVERRQGLRVCDPSPEPRRDLRAHFGVPKRRSSSSNRRDDFVRDSHGTGWQETRRGYRTPSLQKGISEAPGIDECPRAQSVWLVAYRRRSARARLCRVQLVRLAPRDRRRGVTIHCRRDVQPVIQMRWAHALLTDDIVRRGAVFPEALSGNADGWEWGW
jgi:hypothetical protein